MPKSWSTMVKFLETGEADFLIGMRQITQNSVLDIPTPFRMTPCPHRLQLLPLWTWGILMVKMTFWRNKCMSKVVYTFELGVLNIPTPVRMTTCPHRLQLQTSWTLMGKMVFQRHKCLAKVVPTMLIRAGRKPSRQILLFASCKRANVYSQKQVIRQT